MNRNAHIVPPTLPPDTQVTEHRVMRRTKARVAAQTCLAAVVGIFGLLCLDSKFQFGDAGWFWWAKVCAEATITASGVVGVVLRITESPREVIVRKRNWRADPGFPFVIHLSGRQPPR